MVFSGGCEAWAAQNQRGAGGLLPRLQPPLRRDHLGRAARSVAAGGGAMLLSEGPTSAARSGPALVAQLVMEKVAMVGRGEYQCSGARCHPRG